MVALGLMLCVSPALLAQRSGGLQFHGIPGSVTSPGVDGRPRGIPGSVTDPTPARGFVGLSMVPGGRRFNGDHGEHGHGRFRTPVVAVPYYGYYGYPYLYNSEYTSTEQPQPQQPLAPQVIIIKEESSRRDDDRSSDDRDSRESNHEQIARAAPPAPPQPSEDSFPMTTLVFRDGHKSEVRNYAIVGSNLIDLTKSPVMKKIPLASLDLDATRKENEDNGIDFHLP